MATITGLTASRMQEIIDKTIVDANVVSDHLLLTLEDGSTIDAGSVLASPPLVVTSEAELAAITPSDGLEVYYQVSTSVRWHFEYDENNARWMKVGGPPLYVEETAQVDTVSTGYADLGGPSATAPLDGSYLIQHGAEAWNNGGAGSLGTIYMSYNIGATGAVDADAARNRPLNGAEEITLFRKTRKTLAATDAIAARYKTNSGSIRDFFRNRHVSIDPEYVTV